MGPARIGHHCPVAPAPPWRANDALRLDVRDGHLHVAGELDAHTAPALRDAGRAVLADGDLVLDLSELTFIDSRGLGSLLGLYRTAAERDRGMSIRGASGYVRQTLEIAGLRSLLPES
jgi:anti-sigma B factor antagonist